MYLIGGYILLSQLIKATYNYKNILPPKIAIGLIILITITWITLILLSKSKKIKWKKFPIKKLGIKTHLFFSGAIIGLIITLLFNNTHEKNTSFVFDDTTKYNVLLLPFSPDVDCNILETNLENSLIERFNNIELEDKKEINFHFDNSTPCFNDIKDVVKTLVKSNANMAIWGSYEEDCNEPNKVRLRFVARESEIDSMINIGDTEMQELENLKDLREGYLQKDIDLIIYTTIGINKFNKRKYEDAINYLKKGNPSPCMISNLIIGDAYLKMHKANEAIEHFESIEGNCDDYFTEIFLYNLGDSYKMKNEISKADSIFSECIKLNPTSAECYFGKASNLHLGSKYNEAKINYKKAIELEYHSPDPYTNLAEIYNRQDSFELEMSTNKYGLSKFTSDFKLNYNYARNFEMKAQIDSAYHYYERASQFNDVIQLPKYAMAICLRKLKKYEESILLSQKLIEKSPDSLIYKEELIISYYESNQLEKTIKLADDILSVDVNNIEAIIYKGYSLSEKGNFERAFEIMMDAYYIDPNHKDVKYFFKQSTKNKIE